MYDGMNMNVLLLLSIFQELPQEHTYKTIRYLDEIVSKTSNNQRN